MFSNSFPLFPRSRFPGDTSSSYQLWRVLGERKDYIDDLLETWKANQLDVLLCPAFPMPAPKPSYPTRIMGELSNGFLPVKDP